MSSAKRRLFRTLPFPTVLAKASRVSYMMFSRERLKSVGGVCKPTVIWNMAPISPPLSWTPCGPTCRASNTSTVPSKKTVVVRPSCQTPLNHAFFKSNEVVERSCLWSACSSIVRRRFVSVWTLFRQ